MAARRTGPTAPSSVLSLIRQMRGGALYQAEFGMRMRGEGPIAELLARALRRGGEAPRPQPASATGSTRWRFRVPESARTALVDAKRDARQMKLL